MLSFKSLFPLLLNFGLGIAARTDCNITDPDIWIYTAVCGTDIFPPPPLFFRPFFDDCGKCLDKLRGKECGQIYDNPCAEIEIESCELADLSFLATCVEDFGGFARFLENEENTTVAPSFAPVPQDPIECVLDGLESIILSDTSCGDCVVASFLDALNELVKEIDGVVNEGDDLHPSSQAIIDAIQNIQDFMSANADMLDNIDLDLPEELEEFFFFFSIVRESREIVWSIAEGGIADAEIESLLENLSTIFFGFPIIIAALAEIDPSEFPAPLYEYFAEAIVLVDDLIIALTEPLVAVFTEYVLGVCVLGVVPEDAKVVTAPTPSPTPAPTTSSDGGRSSPFSRVATAAAVVASSSYFLMA